MCPEGEKKERSEMGGGASFNAGLISQREREKEKESEGRKRETKKKIRRKQKENHSLYLRF